MALPLIALWLLESVAALLGEEAQKRLQPGWERKLARRTSRRVRGLKARRVRAFLRDERTFALLARGTEADGEELRNGLAEALTPKFRPRSATREARIRVADEALPFLLSEFMSALDPSSAVSVATDRITNRIDELGHQPGQWGVANTIREEVFSELVRQLPPNSRREVRQYAELDGAGARRLLHALVLDERGVSKAVLALLEQPANWLDTSASNAWLCLGEVAFGHGHTEAAARAFQLAIETGAPNAARWYVRAALGAMAAENEGLAQEFADGARNAGGDDLLDLYEGFRSGDWGLVADVSHRLKETGHPDADFALGVKAQAELLDRRWDECITTCRERLQRDSQITTAHLTLARALLSRIQEGRTPNAVQDWREGMSELRVCRDLRREWEGPSDEAVSLACRAAILIHDFGLAMKLGRQQPAGEATAEEAKSQEVMPVVIAAATANGRFDVASELAPLLTSEFERCHVEGLIAERNDDSATARDRYLTCSRLASNADELGTALLSLGSVGEWPLPRLEELRADEREVAERCVAMSEMTRGLYDSAIQRLRPDRSRHGMELLAMTEAKAGRIEDSVATLHREFNRFQDAGALVRIVETALQNGDTERAREEADAALALVPGGTFQWLELQRLRVEIAAQLGHWGQVVSHATAFLAEEKGDPSLTWALLVGLNNVGRIPDAVDVLRSDHELVPPSRDHALLLLSLLREMEADEQLVARCVELGWDYEEDEVICSAALMVAYEKSGEIQLDASLVSHLHRLTAAFIDRFPASSYFERLEFGSVDELVPQLRERLEPGVAALTEGVKKVLADGHPQGVLALLSGRTYTEVLIRRGAGVMPILRPEADSRQLECEAARNALDGECVLDVSALATISLQPQLMRLVQGSFRTMTMHPAAVLDIRNGRVALQSRSTTSLAWDIETDRLITIEIEQDMADSLAARADWIAETASSLDVPQSNLPPGRPELTHEQAERIAPWVGSLELARHRGLPLLSDDVGMQRLAESEGVAVFSLPSLVQVLQQENRADQGTVDSLRQLLLENWAIDLLPTADEVVALGETGYWNSGPGLMQLNRPTFWESFVSGFSAFRQILLTCAQARPETEILWVTAALRGIALAAASDEAWEEAAARIMSFALWLNGWSADLFPQLLQQARVVGSDFGRTDPLGELGSYVFTLLTSELPRPVAAAEVVRLIAELREEDRLIILRKVLTDET
ncbi:MAG: hypothetical protein WD739_11870 [Actinomycetota bacterium]